MTQRTIQDILRNDLKYNWHPYTQMKDCEALPPIPICRAKGIKLFCPDGKFYYDTVSSWWCNVHGHGHAAMNRAIAEQCKKLDHVMFAGFTHEPAIELSKKLIKMAPKGLSRVFYSDNGSTAVEVALKMSFQYWKNMGYEKKERFIALDYGYHGDTIGTMSVGGIGIFNKVYKSLFYKALRVKTPYCYRCPLGLQKCKCRIDCLSFMEKALKNDHEKIAAIIVEPVLMGAGGMIIYPPEYLKGVETLARKYNVHLILDEVASAFGRTGKMFACEHAKVSPDFICISKGLTSGYLPLGATLTTDKIYKSFYDDYEKMKTFFHGHTFTANPILCKIATTNLEIFRREKTLKNVKKIERFLRKFSEEIKNFNFVGDVRNIGTVLAVEIVKSKISKKVFQNEQRVGYQIYKIGLKNGLILRPIGNVAYLFLPLSTTIEEVKIITSLFKKSLSFFGDSISLNETPC
ncbi:MAG TPA: adenosylmethionine--8-amino-7-oxononanoate transaminase [Candidatus Omnitrophota bacterium]|nr:adenosylmethionine--8-amino-7-oxononanoate transaminase [Candidatus Omnitrophota bacterium]HPS20441.1 adenosylmethionine--8-amino-7-oxononanoate transaminase [Candidatus Omnitrophota bacterium]